MGKDVEDHGTGEGRCADARDLLQAMFQAVHQFGSETWANINVSTTEYIFIQIIQYQIWGHTYTTQDVSNP